MAILSEGQGLGQSSSIPAARSCSIESAPSRLLSLAEELILLILDQIQDPTAYCRVGRTCSYLNKLSEPYIYRNCLVQDARDAVDLVRSLRSVPARTTFVRSLEVMYGKGTNAEDGLEILNTEIHGLRNLKDWTIESPCVNDTHWRPVGVSFHCHGKIDYIHHFRNASIERPIEQRQLQNLQSFTLHSHIKGNDNLFTLGPGAVLFHHPTLRHLHIACFDILPTDLYLSPPNISYSTALQSLELEECNIDAYALKDILTIPKALERLTIGERIYRFQQSPILPLCQQPNSFLQALKRQAHSLKYLKHTGIGTTQWRINRVDISNRADILALENVEELDIRIDSILQWYIGVPRHAAEPPIAPRSLKILRIHDVHHAFLDTCPRLFHRDTSYWLLPNNETKLTLLNLVLASKQTSQETILADLWDDLPNEERRTRVYEFGRRLKEGGGTRVLIEAVKTDGYIPPFMFGEIRPTQIVAYDSDHPVLFGNQRDEDVVERAKLPGWEDW